MGKKNRKKNGKRKLYNKNQFKGIFCAGCGICSHSGSRMFCYQEGYRANPDGFFKVHKNLIKAKDWLNSESGTAIGIDMNRFGTIFCSSLCPESPDCKLLALCYGAFLDQAEGNGPKILNRKKKSKEKLIFESYPTFFSSDDEAWKRKIEEIFADGDNNRQQDKAEESSAGA